MKGTKKYGNKIFIIMADYKEPGNRCGGYDR